MDTKNRALLLHHQQSLVDDLDVSYIIDELFTRNAITTEEFDHIFQLSNRADRTRYLIETILQNGTNDTFEAFVDSLAKDYRWLWEKLTVDHNETMFNDSFEDSLSRGDVPRLPDHYVRRVAVQNKVAEKLKLLTRHNFLVLHGMSGSGKTSVVIGVLRDNPELITTNFNGVVFWLNLDGTKTDDDIVAQQTKLYRKTSSRYAPNSYMNSSISMSSIGSNADTHSLSSYDCSWQDLRDRLKGQFSETNLKEALLILDDVNEKKCVEAFDVGCKILITTRDTDVVANFNPTIINIENHFTESETLQLFASCLDVSVSQLPRQAKRLHEICKGSPFNLTLLGAQLAENKERLIDDHRAWNNYLSRLEKKEFFFLTRNNNNPMKTIEMCINSLKPNILTLFKMLTVLPDNAKVSAKVLSKLWNKEVNEVETIMKQLRSKSLIIEFYDHDQRNYIYEIHDLIMNYLRTCTSEEDVKKLHADFLKSYNYDSISKAPVEIVDDGYIAFYIGHHILNTKNLNNKWQLFNRLFLDLKFLGNKVRLTGPADVILDLHKYENYIAEDDFDHELLFSIKSFLSAHGNDLYRYPRTDIMQSILQHEVKGNLYTKALQIAHEQCAKNELYFEFLHEQNVEEITPSNIDVKEIITSVCFLGDYALVGTMKGMIKFFHISTNKLKKEVPTGSPIKWIGVCPINPPLVAALSFDGVIKLWYIDDLGQDDTDDIIEEEPEESFNNNYPSNGIVIHPKRGAFINCRWANNSETLLAHTAKLIIVYDCKGEVLKVIDSLEREREILCCIPCNHDRYAILATSGSTNNLEIVDLATKERVMSYEENDILLDILTVPGSNRIITLKQYEVVEHHFKHNSSFTNWNMCRCKKVISANDIKADLTFLSFAVNKSGTLLFVSTDDSRVICVDLKTHSRVFDLENRRGNVVSMGVSEVCDDFMPGSDVLLTGTGTIENSAKVWYLDAAYVSQTTRNGKTRLTTKFDVSFVHSLTPQTPQTPFNSGAQSSTSTPKRHQSFVNHKEVEKKVAKKTMSLDRHNLKPLMLKGICNGNGEEGSQPLLAVVDDRNNIQIMRGRKILTEITTKHDEHITTMKVSPCNQYILYGLRNGNVIKYTLRTKETRAIMDVYSPVQYLNFVNSNLLVVAGKNRCLMAYRLTCDGDWKPEMMQRGNTHLGSQEILNDIQGKKKISPPLDPISDSGSETSLSSKDRLFPNGDTRSLSNSSGLVNCFWVPDYGLVTVESNATIKLWDKELKLVTVLNGRQTDIHVCCTAFQKNILVFCDDNKGFQTFELRSCESGPLLHQLQQYKLNNRIISCDLTADGYILAMGLDSGEVVVWNVPGKRQLRLLKHHKTRVQHCSFSPVPDRLRSLNTSVNSPQAHSPSYAGAESDDAQPPLVLVTMASEIVWWNVTYLIKMRANKGYWRNGWNVVTPIASPMTDARTDLTAQMNNISLGSPQKNFFFGDGQFNAQDCWRAIWRNKTYKEGSKRKEILACIKLSGMNAKKLCHDDKFSCFVTVDNPGHIHIMNVMRSQS